jgi:glycosyltransferase involved in cell wall biosynthesis
VSVIIPCYRAAATIRRAVASVFCQALLPKEILLVEDGSADGGATLEALRDIKTRQKSKVKIKVIALQKNQGPAAARNIAWAAASEPYVAFLDADDSWHPRKLEIQYRWMAANPEVALTGHPVICVREEQLAPEVPKIIGIEKIGRFSILLRNRLSTPSVMLLRSIPYRFEETKRFAEDQLLWHQVILSGRQACLIKAPLGFLFKPRYGARGLSATMWEMEKGELDNYRKARNEGNINGISLSLLWAYSLAKFALRCIRRRKD